jgi:gluconolactonase
MIPKLGSLLAAARAAGVLVVHVHYIVETDRPTLQRNSPLFRSIETARSVRRGSWGARAFAGVEPNPGDVVIEKMRMNAFFATRLEPLLRGAEIDTVVVAGALTNLSIEHTARHGADAGFRMIVPSDGTCSFNEEWHQAGLSYGLTLVAEIATCTEIERAITNGANLATQR